MLYFLQEHFFDICRQANTVCCFSCRNISLHICREANPMLFSLQEHLQTGKHCMLFFLQEHVQIGKHCMFFFLQEHLQTGKHRMLYFLQEHFFDICRQANTVCCFSCRNISLHICREANPMLFSCRNILHVVFLTGTCCTVCFFSCRQTGKHCMLFIL